MSLSHQLLNGVIAMAAGGMHAKVRPSGSDQRFRFEPGEEAEIRSVRFRTLGCYPLSGAVESTADTLPEIIQEMLLATRSEREGRVIDYDEAGSMEEKKRAGYY